MMYLLLLTHLFLTFRLRFPQRRLFKGIRYSFSPHESSDGIGTYRAFAAALGTTIGPGNITGVAIAVSLGGVGSVFWMWLCGIVAMSTKYSESLLAIKYPLKKHGTAMGGTMSLLDRLGNKKLAVFWSLCCGAAGLLMGSSVPANSLSSSLPVPTLVTGVILCGLTIITVCFGVRAIANLCSLVVPVMSVGFMLLCTVIILKNITSLPEAFAKIFAEAFNINSAVGGGLAAVVKQGVMRGMYSNESGLGSGGVLAAEAGDGNHDMSALSAMTTVFWDTVVMCALTGVMFAVTGADYGMSANEILSVAFGNVAFGTAFYMLSMSLFVFACIIGWYYIAKRALSYVFEKTGWYDIMFVSAVFIGAVADMYPLWRLADLVNLLMLIPSLYSVFKMLKINFT